MMRAICDALWRAADTGLAAVYHHSVKLSGRTGLQARPESLVSMTNKTGTGRRSPLEYAQCICGFLIMKR